MRSFFAFLIILFTLVFASAQNEQAPIQEKQFDYNDWTYKNVRTGENLNLRDFAKGKKLVMVVYFAPWCPNWKHDAPMLVKLYDKYKANGLDIIAVGEYDPVDAMKSNLDALKIPFTAVYESENREAREKTTHFQVRRQTGDARKWGSPWYIFIGPSNIESKGGILTKRASFVNGELIEAEGEKFIREKLGLRAADGTAVQAKTGEIEPCEPEKKTAELKKP